jgi:hypothetical protein
MGLDRAVQALERRLGGRELGHVRRLAGALSPVVQPGRARGGQPSQLGVDRRLSERMGDPLVGPDRLAPHPAGPRVLGRSGQRQPGDPVGHRGGGDPLGVEPREQHAQPCPVLADQSLGGNLHVIEEQHELALGSDYRGGQGIPAQPGCPGGDDQ